MVTADDVAGLVLSRFEASPGFAAVCPGGAWFGRGPDVPDAYPYAVYEVTAGKSESFSGSVGLARYTVRAVAYCPQGAAASDPAATHQFLLDALASDEANAWFQEQALRNETDLVLHCLPAASDEKAEQRLREARDVFTPVVSADLLFQSDKGVV